MDENSRTGETSDDIDDQKPTENKTDNVVNLLNQVNVGLMKELDSGPSGIQMLDSRDSSLSDSGPSCNSPPPKYDAVDADADTSKASPRCSPVASREEPRECENNVRRAPDVVEPSCGTIGPPPSYSFVMKQKRKAPQPVPLSETMVTDRPPPPTYAGTRGLYLTPEDTHLERVFNFPSFAEPLWRSHSQPAFCPRCGILVLTTTHSHDSIATHVAALALCLLGCWPCCLLPYCMNICKNTYHHCPICQAFLGAYTPW